MSKKQIPTEKDRAEWKRFGRNDISMDNHQEFVRHVVEDYEHDYNSSVDACIAIGVAGVFVVSRTAYGLSGAQAQFVAHGIKELMGG